MRLSIGSVLALAILAGTTATTGAWARSPVLEYGRNSTPDLRRARELDALGVRAYREGSFREALLLFTESYRAGGPSIELWNVARCHQRLDEDEDAAEVLSAFLSANDILPGDRADATRELATLERRPSTVIVDGSATGAIVSVDGRKLGTAPIATQVAPGRHVVRVESTDGARETEVEAKFGRTIVFRDGTENVDAGDDATPRARRIEIDAQGGLYAQKLGSVSGRVGPSVTLGARLGFGSGRVSGFAGLRGEFYSTSWSSATPEPPLPDCTLPDRYRANALAGLGVAGAAWDATQVVRASLEVGGGLETLFVEHGGGDVLLPTCTPSPGVVPLFAARAEVSFRLARAARVALTPVALALHPAYSGARSSPTDASGIWLRLGASLGLSYDIGL
jgi:hypothetical protein